MGAKNMYFRNFGMGINTSMHLQQKQWWWWCGGQEGVWAGARNSSRDWDLHPPPWKFDVDIYRF